MAKGKNVKNNIDNEFHFNSNLDFQDLAFDVDPFKDDRKPVTKVKDGLVKGIKSRAVNGQFIRGILKDILPKGFGQTLDLSDSIAANARELYYESLKEVQPAVNDFKRVSSNLVPENSKYVPEGIQKLLNKWKDETKHKGRGDLDARTQRDNTIAIQLGEVFKEQAIADENKTRQAQANDKIREGIEMGRHRDMFAVLNHSAMSLSGMYQYQTTINLKYQKKSLELQHRQLFSLYDIVDSLSKTHALQSDAFTKIVKNTGLPDWQKIKFKELARQDLVNKVLEAKNKAVKGMFPNADEYLQMTARKIRDKTMGGIKANIQAFRSGLTEAESGAEMMKGSASPSGLETGAEFVGDTATGALGEKLAKKIKGPLKDFIPALVKASDYLENFNENFVDTLEKFRKSKRWESETGMKGFLIRGAQSMLPTISMDRTFTKISAKDLGDEKPFTLRTDRSINEIIPGYLSRILQEMQIQRTGNPNIDLVDYDQDKGKFVSSTKILKSISRDLFPEEETQRTKEIFDKILSGIDPKNELDQQQRDELSKALFKNKLEVKEPYTGLTGKSGRLTRSYLSGLEDKPEDKLVFSRQLNSLVRGASDPRTKIESYIEQGRQNELLKLGVISRAEDSYTLNVDALFSGKLGQDPFEAYQASKRKKARSDGLRPTGAASSNTLTDNVDKAISDKCNCESYFVDIIHRLDTSIDYYQSIQDIIKTGLNVTVKRGVGRQAATSGAAAATESVKKTGKAVQDKILDAFSDYKQKSGGMTGAGIMGNLASLISVAVNPLSLSSKMTGGMSDKVMEMATDKVLSTAADIIKKKYFNDDPSTTWNGIYVEGEDEPRITSKKLNAGYYASVIMGEVITSPKDINGPIKNVETGEIVISTEELDKLLIRTNDNKLRPLKDFIKRPSGLGSKNNKELYDWLLNKTKQRADAGATALWNRAIKEFEPIKKALTEEAQDVWVSGEKYPRMTATRMHRGHYQDAKTGKIIYLPSEITGEVKDNTGKTVISEEEMGSLLIWDSGKKKFGPIRKILRAVDKIAGGLTWYYTKIGIPLTKFNFRMIAKTAKLAGNVLRMSMGKGPLSVKDVYVGNEEKPRLYAVRIRNGDYYNKSDGKPIFHQDDINGEIVNSDGVVVLPDDDLENLRVYDSILKLFNPLRPLKWIMKTAGKAAAWTLKKGLAVTKFLTRKLGTGAMKMATGFIRYISKPEDVYVRGETFPRLRAVLFKAGRYVSEKTGLTIFLPSDIDGPVWDEQEKIRVLDNGDLQKGLVKEDGTPFKTTMLQNILKGIKTVNKLFSRRIKFTAKDTSVPNKELDLNKDTTGQETVSLLGDIKNIFEDYFTENKVKGDTDGDGDREGSWEDIKAKREADKAKQQSNKPGEKTKDKEGKGGLMGILSSALEAITGMLGGITSLFKGGGVLGGLGKLLGVGRAAGAVAAAAGGMGTLGTIGAGIAAVVSSPVTLGIVGSAVVGYGAYKGYKALRKWMSKPTTLELIRYTQYGFKKEDTSYFSKVVDLEEYVKDFVKVGTDQAEIDEKKMGIEEMMSIFGFSSKDNDHKAQFGTWYIKRFKPVYLTHVSALNILNGSIDLTKVNDLKKELKLKYIEATKFSSGPYTVGTLPILGGKVAASTASDVSAAIETALKEFATTPGGAKKDSTGLYTDGRKPQDLASKGGRMDLGKPDATGKVPRSSVSGASSVGASNLSNTVSAFDLVRFKTYGLKELEVSKIVSLTMLEMQMSKVIKFQGTKASFEGNPNELLEKVTTYFGIPDLFSDQAIAWGKWFRDRFLPVYLNYATLHMQAVNKPPKADSAPVLEANQQYDVALAVSSTGGAWKVTDTPWQGYELNINPDTVKGNLEFLKDAAKQKTVRDQEAKTAQEKNANALPDKKPDSAFVAKTPEYNPPTSHGVTDIKSFKIKPVDGSYNDAGPGTSIELPNTAPSKDIINSDGEKITFRKKFTVLSDGMGTGPTTEGLGSNKPDPAAKIPEPTGPGIGGLKDTITNAAKVVGIDPNIMLTTAAIESDFNPNAKAGTSSASGLMQFINSTWKDTVNKHGAKYGYDQSTSPFDAKASAIMGAHYIKDSLSSLSRSYKGAISSVEAYLVHFMGPGGAAKFLKAMQENPGQYGSQLMPKEAAANQSIFFGSNGPRTLGEIYQWFYNKVRTKAARYGIELPASPGADTSEKSKYVMPTAQNSVASTSDTSQAITSAQSELPKSAYNPVARPVVKQQQAAQASKQAFSSPLSDAVGYNPRTAGTVTEANNASKNTLTADLMKNTESILSQSLSVHKETLDVMKMIYEKINSVGNTETPKSEARKYEAPMAPVPMRKSA
jgi:hypothetical protein